MNQFTKMCDCPEIQGKWVPKDGDRVVWRNPSTEVAEDTVCVVCLELSNWNQQTCIWLPTSDQIWDMLPEGEYYSLERNDFIEHFGEVAFWGFTIGPDWSRQVHLHGPTAQEALIQGVMFELHGKRWSDERWE